MTDPRFDETRVAAYLLGHGSPQEQAAIEERYITDPDFLAEVQAVERDLIDRYVRGELDDMTAFEKQFLSSPPRRERVEFARALMAARAGGSTAGVRTNAGWFLAAAAAAIVAAGAWLLFANRELATPTRDGGREVTAGSPVVPAPEPPPVAPGPAVRGTDPIVALTLSSALVRGSGQPQEVVIGGPGLVRLDLAIDDAVYDSYRVVIRSAEGSEILRLGGLKARRNADAIVVTVELPAESLRDADYTVSLSGVASQAVDELSGYAFRVRTRR